jgi:5-methylthioadenosine/S-adenosylhomocysteine deaminase
VGLDEVGLLRVGMQADIITIDLNRPHLTPFYNPDILVYAAGGADVKHSIIGGQLVLENRRLLTIDLKETMAHVRSLALQLA